MLSSSIDKVLGGYEPISDRLIVVRLNAKRRNIILIQVYEPPTAATKEFMERFYQDLSRAVKQVPGYKLQIVPFDVRRLSLMNQRPGF